MQPASPQYQPQPAPMPPGQQEGMPQAAPPQQPMPAPLPNGEPSGIHTTPASEAQLPRNPNTSQNSLLISEIRDGLVVMSDGSFRAVVACKSINFDLMSDREREAVEFSYQSFLNSLYFPIQILIRSQRVDIGPYLQQLDQLRRNQDNMLLGVLMDDYINFIAALSDETNIMDKQFYIAIPYYITGDVSSALMNSKNLMGGMVNQKMHIKIDDAAYRKAKDELSNRVSSVVNGLFQIGVRSVQLNTKELGELYYNVYNPDTAVREPLGDFDNLTATYVSKGERPVSHTYQGGGY